jgi:hypothetical protein
MPDQPDDSATSPLPAEHIPAWESNPPSGFMLSRRTLLIGGGALMVGGLLTGLSLNSQSQGYRGLIASGNALSLENFTHFSSLVTGFAPDELDPATAQAIYNALLADPLAGLTPSPAAAPAATPAVTGTTGAMTTAAAITATASSAVTSAVTVTSAAAGTPAAALTAAASGASLENLLRKAGYISQSPPQTLDDIESRGVFDDAAYAATANSVIEAWYSGLTYDGGGAATTVAWLPALGWKALSYTAAPGFCGGATGFWNSAPGATPEAEPGTETAPAGAPPNSPVETPAAMPNA